MIVDKNTRIVNSELIVELAKQALNNLPLYKNQIYDTAQFRKEFGTVNIELPRQSGHSTAALQLMYEYPDALCFVRSGSAKKYLMHLLRQHTTDKEVQSRIAENLMVPNGKAMAKLTPWQKRSFIIIDNASHIAESDIDYIIMSIPSGIVLKLG